MNEEHLGFGTLYEKFILGGFFRKFIEQLDIHTVCEYPTNNLMDNNSEEFERAGCAVVRMTALEAGETYDFVWNFCEFERSSDSMQMIREMLGLSKRYMFIVVQNKRNIGVPLHWIYHLFTGRKWDHGRMRQMSLAAVKSAFEHENVRILEHGFFDVPWFILDVYESGKPLRWMAPRSYVEASRMKESLFEGLPNWLKGWLAHHAYVLFEKKPQAAKKADLNA